MCFRVPDRQIKSDRRSKNTEHFNFNFGEECSTCGQGQNLVKMDNFWSVCSSTFYRLSPLISFFLWVCFTSEKEGTVTSKGAQEPSHTGKQDIIVRCPATVAVASYASVR